MKKEYKIDLKARAESLRKKTSDGVVSITSQALNDKTLDELAMIATMLERVGVSLKLTRNENPATGSEYDFLTMKINMEKYNKVLTRGAGRKADFDGKYDKYGKCTVAELQEKLASMTKTGIAKELGCSRMTLYRIIKNIEILQPDENTSIWHYTS